MGSEYLCLLDREDFALVAAGFEPIDEEGTLWKKDNVCFGREAALQSARMGKVYIRWHPKSPVVECGCGRMLSTSGSTTTCPGCGSDHTDPLRNESAEGHQSDESLRPWRPSEDHKAKEGLPDLELPFLVLPF